MTEDKTITELEALAKKGKEGQQKVRLSFEPSLASFSEDMARSESAALFGASAQVYDKARAEALRAANRVEALAADAQREYEVLVAQAETQRRNRLKAVKAVIPVMQEALQRMEGLADALANMSAAMVRGEEVLRFPEAVHAEIQLRKPRQDLSALAREIEE